jgi:hypothetical protein
MGHPIPDRHRLAVILVSPGGSIPWTQQAPTEGSAQPASITLLANQRSECATMRKSMRGFKSTEMNNRFVFNVRAI